MKGRFNDDVDLHLGYKIKRTREVIGVKQYTLAEACGWSQQQMSKIENSELVEDDVLDLISKELGVTSEFIKNFKEDKAVYYIQNNNVFRENSSTQHFKPTLNNSSSDQILSLLEKYLADDQKKTSQIESLTRTVLDLAEEVKKLKSSKGQ